MSGFFAQNLWYMRQFYHEYSANELLPPLVGEISWAKQLLIMARCKDPQERTSTLCRPRMWLSPLLLEQHQVTTTNDSSLLAAASILQPKDVSP